MGLTARMALAYALLVVALEAVILVVLDLRLASELHSNAVHKGETLAATLCEAVSAAVLTEDAVAALRLLEAARRSDERVRYVYVLDPAGRPIVDTFPAGVPRDLLQADGPGRVRLRGVLPMQTDEGLVYDVAAPLLDGRLGVLHLGLSTRGVDAALGHARVAILVFAGLVLVLGGPASIAVARGLTRPLERLCEVAARVRGGDLEARAPEGGPVEYAALARAWNEVTDTLARRVAEVRALHAYQERLLDSMGDAICVIGPDRTVEYANAAARRHGCSQERRCSQLLADAVRPCAGCPAETVMTTGEPIFQRHEAPDGTVSEVAVLPLDRPDGTRAVMERRRDITAFVRLERQLVGLERMALLGEVAAGVAHEVGNPLDGLRGCLEVVAKSRADPARAERFLGLAAEGVDRIEAIVRRLLSYARPLPLHKQEVCLNDVVQQAMLLLSVRAERGGVRLEVRPASGLPPVNADVGGLSQALVNLVINALDAIKAKGAGGGQVVVETLLGAGATSLVGVRVTDDGIGMTPEVRQRAGTPFFTTKPPGEGTGLGLSVSRGLLEQHGGRLEIDSQPGLGASFTVWLPACGAGDEGAAPAEATCAAAS